MDSNVRSPYKEHTHTGALDSKRYGHLYPMIYDTDNLIRAHMNARKGKTNYHEVKMVDEDPLKYINNIQKMLVDKTYKTSPYKVFKKYDKTKEREIYVLPYYPDRIIQWAVVQVLEPIWLSTLISGTYSSLKGRGIHKALHRLKHDLRDEKGTQYCLKLDVKKFYPSIDHTILKQTLRRKIKDPDVLELLDGIVDSAIGVPIGNYLSQYFGNLYLCGFDHWLKEEKHVKYYYRYCDDLVILHEDKAFLHGLLREIQSYLADNLRLRVKENWQVFPTRTRGIDFVGYRCFGDYTLLRKSTALRMKRKMRAIKHKDTLTPHDKGVIASYEGWLKWCDSHRLHEKYIEPIGV